MTSHTSGSRPDWTLVLPVKGGPDAKTRLDGPVGLAEAIALDTLDAVVACAAVATVVVVTADNRFAVLAADRGATVSRERRPGAGLNAAVRDALTHRTGERSGPTAVLLADVPALRPEDLGAALGRLSVLLHQPERPPDGRPGWAVVPDAEGSGTVLLAATEPDALHPAFGAGSAAAHEARGALRVDLDCPRLRCDVDTPADLERARALGLGPHTAAALGGLAPLGPIA